MGGQGSGLTLAEKVNEEVDDARFELKESQAQLRQAAVMLHHAEGVVESARRREGRALACLTLALKRNGYTGLTADEVVRVEGMSVRALGEVEPLGDPGAVGRFHTAVAAAAREKAGPQPEAGPEPRRSRR